MARKRNEEIKLMLTKEEKEIIKSKAESLNMNVSEFIRKAMSVGSFVKVDTRGLDSLTFEINKIGVNINQIAKKLNENGSLYSSEFKAIQSDVQYINDCINELCQKLNVKERA